MSSIGPRNAWLVALTVGAPLVLAVVEVFHPHPGDLLRVDVALAARPSQGLPCTIGPIR